MANILKKFGHKIVELDKLTDSLEGLNLIINGSTYASTDLDQIETNRLATLANAFEISSNDTDIATNVGDIATNTASIAGLASASTYGPGAKVITSTDVPVEGGTIDLDNSGLVDDDIPELDAADFAVEDLIIFDGNSAPVVGKVSSIAGEVLIISFVGVTALVQNKLYHVQYNLLASPGSEEKRSIYSMEGAAEAMTKIADEVWDNTDGIQEGTSNLFFTDGRAQTAAVVDSSAGSETVKASSVAAMKNYVGAEIAAIPAVDVTNKITKGGDADAADMVIGTNDNFDVVIERNNIPQMTFEDDRITFLPSVINLPSGYFGMRLGGSLNNSIVCADNGQMGLYCTHNIKIKSLSKSVTLDVSGGTSKISLITAKYGSTDSAFIELKTGYVETIYNSGKIDLSTGPSVEGNSGTIDLITGASTGAGNSADITIGTGVVNTGTKGEVIISDVKYPIIDKDAASKLYVDTQLALGASKTTPLVAGEVIAAGDLVYLKIDGKAWKVVADGTQNREDLELIFFAESAVASAATGEFLMPRADITLSGGTIGAIEYLDVTSGDKTQIAPSALGTDVVMLGRWISATVFHFAPKYLMSN